MTTELTYVRNYETNTKYFIELCEERIKDIKEIPYKSKGLEDEITFHEGNIKECSEKLKEFHKINYVRKQVNWLYENEPVCMFKTRIGA